MANLGSVTAPGSGSTTGEGGGGGTGGGTAGGSSTGAALGTTGGATSGGTTGVSFYPVAPASYVNKIKNLLTGAPATQSEIAGVSTDPNSLAELIDTWMQTPQYETVILQFFGQAFQQTEFTAQDLTYHDLTEYGPGVGVQANVAQIFPKTVWQMVQNGTPFNQTVTTQTFMLNTDMMMYLAYIDSFGVSDTGAVTQSLVAANPNFKYTLETTSEIPLTDSVNPNNPNFMVFYWPHIPSTIDPNCGSPTSVTVTAHNVHGNITQQLHNILTGQSSGYECLAFRQNGFAINGNNKVLCQGQSNTGILQASDANDWRMVTIRQPAVGEATTPFYDVPHLRTMNSMVLHIPRIGYMMQPAFLATWNTNPSNQARVTINQTMIVGLNRVFDESNTTLPQSTAAVDPVHAPTTSSCYSCHVTLDPMRQFFRHDLSLAFHPQTNPNELNLPPQFAFAGVSMQGASLADLATQIANHPTYAMAWTQKVCTWANAAACDPTDPELQRIAKDFASSNFQFNVLMREMLSSPSVTFAANSITAQSVGQTVGITLVAQLCNNLSARLNTTDICGLTPGAVLPSALKTLPALILAMPAAQYSRGSATPPIVTTPSLVYRRGLEQICEFVALQVVDNGATSIYASSAPNDAINSMVTNFLGLSGAQATATLSVLQGHYNAGLAAKSTATVAMRSTFTLACLSPYNSSIGGAQ